MPHLRDQLQQTLQDSYTLDRELGGGGMSRVFVAEELRLGRRVVVKVLSPELAAGISAERFEREIRMAASLQQANIVPVLTAGVGNGLPYYTMPFVEGESLRARLDQGPALTGSEITRILGDVARALQYAHARGVVHRDIKPDNVLLSGGTAVVTDFGIAKAISASRTDSGATLTQVGTSIGTPAYMSPEQAAGDPDIDQRSDLYAFGCMAYELLAGHTPFHGRTPQRTLSAHLSETPAHIGELRPDVPAALADLVMRCLAKEPGDRPQSASAVLTELDIATSSGAGIPAMSRSLLHGPGTVRALLVYGVATLLVVLVARVAATVIGLPPWVVPGALAVMAPGLPIILFTGYVQRVARRRALATPGGAARRQGTMATLALKASPHVSWQRTSRGGMYAFGAFAAVVAGYMVLRALGIGPEGSLMAAGKLTTRDRLLVTDFSVIGADSTVGSVVSEGVRVALGQSPSLTLMSATETASALERMQLPASSRVRLDLARRIAAREGVKAIVDGDVTVLGSGYAIALRLVSVDSGTVLARYQAAVDGPSQIVEGIDKVTRQLRGRIGESLRSVRATPPLAQVTTSSFDALSLYTQAVRVSEMGTDDATAIPLLRQALALDSTFAMAWRKLGVAMFNRFYPASEVNEVLDRAFALRDRLPERERYLTEGTYYMLGTGRDRENAIAAYEALLRRGDSTIARVNLASLYTSRREFARAEELLRAEFRQRPGNIMVAGNLVSTLHVLGRLDEADSLLSIIRRIAPNAAVPLVRRGDILYARGQLDEQGRLLDSLRLHGPPAVRGLASYDAATSALVRGRLREGEDLYVQGYRLDSALGTPPPPPLFQAADSAFVDALLRGNGEAAVRRLDAALARHPITELAEGDRPYTDIASLYAMAGRPDRARAILAQREAELTDTALARWQQPRVHRALGEIALAEGRPLDAIAEFHRSDRKSDGPAEDPLITTLFSLGRAFDRAGMADSTIVTFEAFLSTPFPFRAHVDRGGRAAILRRLGELYEERGDWAKASSYYADFVELWKNADPELQPQVEEVRVRLARGTDRGG